MRLGLKGIPQTCLYTDFHTPFRDDLFVSPHSQMTTSSDDHSNLRGLLLFPVTHAEHGVMHVGLEVTAATCLQYTL